MSGTFVDYKGYGFWANDVDLATWLHYFVLALAEDRSGDAWLEEVRDFYDQSSRYFGVGLVYIDLDAHADTDEHREQILQGANKAQRILEERGERISIEELTAIGQQSVQWLGDQLTAPLLAVGTLIIKLLKQEVQDAGSGPTSKRMEIIRC